MFGFAKMLEDRDHSAEAIPLVIDGIRMFRNAKGKDWNAEPSLAMLERFVRTVAFAPKMTDDKYMAALSGAEVLVGEKPQQPTYLGLLGVAHFRAGHFEDALKHLVRVDETSPQRSSENGSTESESEQSRSGADNTAEYAVVFKAFQAMAQFRLGHADMAKAVLIETQELMNKPANAQKKEFRAIVLEAEALISQSSLNP